MRLVLVAVLLAVVLAGCSSSVRGVASPPEQTVPSPTTTSPRGQLPGGAQPPCTSGNGCDEPGGTAAPAGVACAPLPSAMAGFDARARWALGGGDVSAPATSGEATALTDLVLEVVDRCGYQVMVDVANQYRNPLYTWLRDTAVVALGEISALPPGMRCVELRALGLGPKQAVDYWFLWNSPGLMDADSNGIPCETVWSDVERYLPAYY